MKTTRTVWMAWASAALAAAAYAGEGAKNETKEDPGGQTNLYLVIDVTHGAARSQYPVTYLPAPPAGGWTDEYKTTKLVMRRIPAGTFTMGSPTNELGRDPDETQHTVTLTQDFYIGVFEVTQEQWERVTGNWTAYGVKPVRRDVRPVEQVSYYEIR